MTGLPASLVQELNVGTVVTALSNLKILLNYFKVHKEQDIFHLFVIKNVLENSGGTIFLYVVCMLCPSKRDKKLGVPMLMDLQGLDKNSFGSKRKIKI